MISADLSGKRILVTGGLSGIGKATVELFAANGARVAANFLPDDSEAAMRAADWASRRYAHEIVAAPGDVSDSESAERMVQSAIGDLGGLDFLVNNAGTPATDGAEIDYSDLAMYTPAFWQKVIGTNLYGPFFCSRAAAPALKVSGGAIVCISSIAGEKGGGSLSYSSSKAGLNILTKNLAAILAPDVRVNAVAPGLVDTPWTMGFSQERKSRSIGSAFIPKLLQPQDVAEVVLFLCAGPPMINAQVITIDGGRR